MIADISDQIHVSGSASVLLCLTLLIYELFKIAERDIGTLVVGIILEYYIPETLLLKELHITSI